MKKHKAQIVGMLFVWTVVIELFVGTWIRLNVITDPAYSFAFFMGGGLLFVATCVSGFTTVIKISEDEN